MDKKFKLIIYANIMTMKSSQFHGSLKNENLSIIKPLAIILRQASNV